MVPYYQMLYKTFSPYQFVPKAGGFGITFQSGAITASKTHVLQLLVQAQCTCLKPFGFGKTWHLKYYLRIKLHLSAWYIMKTEGYIPDKWIPVGEVDQCSDLPWLDGTDETFLLYDEILILKAVA